MTMMEERRSNLTRNEIIELLDGYPDIYLECRAYNHPWNPPPRKYDRRVDKSSGLEVLEKPVPCMRCGTVRYDRLAWIRGRWVQTDDIGGAKYDYPDGYLFPAGNYVSSIEIREYIAWRDTRTR